MTHAVAGVDLQPAANLLEQLPQRRLDGDASFSRRCVLRDFALTRHQNLLEPGAAGEVFTCRPTR